MIIDSGAESRPAARRRLLGKSAEIGIFLAPALFLYILLVMLPIVLAVFYSGFRWDGLAPLTDFVGLGNYQRALADKYFVGAIGNNFLVIFLSLALQLPMALGLALALNRRFLGRTALRLVFFAPYVISEAITAVVWYMLLQPHGMVNTLAQGAGFGFIDFLGDRSIVMLTLFVIISWKYFGFSMILYLAGLSQIPRELLEAAAIDGAGDVQQLRYVTLPLLGPTIRVTAFLSVIGSLQLFDIPYIMTNGGPFHASETMATYMVQNGWTSTSLGYGSAVAVILFLIALVISLAYQRFVLRRDIEGGATAMAG